MADKRSNQKATGAEFEGFWIDLPSEIFTAIFVNGIPYPDTQNNRRKILAAKKNAIHVFAGPDPEYSHRFKVKILCNVGEGLHLDMLDFATIQKIKKTTHALSKIGYWLTSEHNEWFLQVSRALGKSLIRWDDLIKKGTHKGWTITQTNSSFDKKYFQLKKGKTCITIVHNTDSGFKYLILGPNVQEWQKIFDSFRKLYHDLSNQTRRLVLRNCVYDD